MGNDDYLARSTTRLHGQGGYHVPHSSHLQHQGGKEPPAVELSYPDASAPHEKYTLLGLSIAITNHS